MSASAKQKPIPPCVMDGCTEKATQWTYIGMMCQQCVSGPGGELALAMRELDRANDRFPRKPTNAS